MAQEGRDEKGRFSEHNAFSKNLTTNGRPPIFKTPEEMEQKAAEYFESLISKDKDGNVLFIKPASICGAALYLGFNSRKNFVDYMNKPDFCNVVTRIKMAVERDYEEGLHGKGASGCQFALKNMGWDDKQKIEQDLKVSGAPVINFGDNSKKDLDADQ